MAQDFQWDRGLLETDTGMFDRALHRLRRVAAEVRSKPALIGDLARSLQEQPGITRREFDRRFRLVVSTIADDDPASLEAIAVYLRDTSPEALNAVRTLLPAELKHLAFQIPSRQQPQTTAPVVKPSTPHQEESGRSITQPPKSGRFGAVALIGTSDEHVRNKSMLANANIAPLQIPTIEQLWQLATTGLCGFVIGGSAWGHVPKTQQNRAIRLICEYSTFLFVRVSLDGLSSADAESFIKDAAEYRCGTLDGQKFCHGLDCDLTPADITSLQSIARFLEDADAADFFPLGLSESDAALLRLIAADRRHPDHPLRIRKLGTRELAGGQSGARVFMLSDGTTQPFVAKVGEAESLSAELQRYRKWVQNWEPSVTHPTFHSHVGRAAAISYRLQATPDGNGAPAPTLEDCLEQLRMSEWNSSVSIDKTLQKSDDLFVALERIIERLVDLNSRPNRTSDAGNFWLNWPICTIAKHGIDFEIIDQDWQPMKLSELVANAVTVLEPNVARGVIHGDIHGRNILVLDRSPAFIDFAYSGPGHPLEDLVRLDAIVRSAAMRMLIGERTLGEILKAVYIDGTAAKDILEEHRAIAASPLTGLAVRTAVKVREAALKVAEAHSLGLLDLLSMTCVVAGNILVARNPGSGIERAILSVVGPYILTDRPLTSPHGLAPTD
jgi:hypothetical protein